MVMAMQLDYSTSIYKGYLGCVGRKASAEGVSDCRETGADVSMRRRRGSRIKPMANLSSQVRLHTKDVGEANHARNTQ